MWVWTGSDKNGDYNSTEVQLCAQHRNKQEVLLPDSSTHKDSKLKGARVWIVVRDGL
jgi:hypothetical protein